MSEFTLEQVMNFLAVVDHGSFSGAAKVLNRAQSAVSYSVQKLEEQVGIELFDRSHYRPVLTVAGRSLLPQARRISEDISTFHRQAQGVIGDAESLLTVVVDSLYSHDLLIKPLQMLYQQYPKIQLQLHSRTHDDIFSLFEEPTPVIGIMSLYEHTSIAFTRVPLKKMEFFMVASPSHPLAKKPAPLNDEALRSHLQCLRVDSSGLVSSRDYGVYSANTWRFEDVNSMLSILLSGIGYGMMPDHLVKDHVERGDLVCLRPENWEGVNLSIPITIYGAWRDDAPIGPVAQYFLQCLREGLNINY